MKATLINLIFVLILFLKGNAQNNIWTKDARSMVYNELLNELTPYKNISQEQKESISLCGLDEITKKYLMSDYQSKIEVEIKRIKSATIGQCSKNIGVELQIVQEQMSSNPQEEWSKEAKSNFYNEAISMLVKYDNVTQQQKENVGLCFSNELTANYSKSQMAEMLDIEVKKIKNDAMRKCLEKNNITLKKSENFKLDKKTLTGCWQSYESTICFHSTGELDMKSDKGFIKKTKWGKWFLEPEKIIIMIKDVKETYTVLYFNGESLKLEEEGSKREVHFTKMMNFK